jgi:hypothetical protein
VKGKTKRLNPSNMWDAVRVCHKEAEKCYQAKAYLLRLRPEAADWKHCFGFSILLKVVDRKIDTNSYLGSSIERLLDIGFHMMLFSIGIRLNIHL